ncbi:MULTISPECIES: hypothetical protein [unclassified Nostoc]|uniref:hypothetical protein n=1 Tax=unclassified Nostoc TaxID=2593658 RepID=UPI000B953BBA|nr:hypothetical protein [Nostoc sp. 'Peltigera membranacea cyanobiont' 232]OYE05644.1 hypothetical protein CDG79_06795 [Nostoc sp. 'Peltigera membranacea cyanobiont' 232]
MKVDTSVASFLLAFIGALSGWIAWWSSKLKFERQQATQEAVRQAEKALNEERDFNHLKRNQEQISEGIAHGFDGIEQILDELMKEISEIKSWLIRYGVVPGKKQE